MHRWFFSLSRWSFLNLYQVICFISAMFWIHSQLQVHQIPGSVWILFSFLGSRGWQSIWSLFARRGKPRCPPWTQQSAQWRTACCRPLGERPPWCPTESRQALSTCKALGAGSLSSGTPSARLPWHVVKVLPFRSADFRRAGWSPGGSLGGVGIDDCWVGQVGQNPNRFQKSHIWALPLSCNFSFKWLWCRACAFESIHWHHHHRSDLSHYRNLNYWNRSSRQTLPNYLYPIFVFFSDLAYFVANSTVLKAAAFVATSQLSFASTLPSINGVAL